MQLFILGCAVTLDCFLYLFSVMPVRIAVLLVRFAFYIITFRYAALRQGRASTLLTLPCAQVGALCAALSRIALARRRAPFYLALRGLRSEVRRIHVC